MRPDDLSVQAIQKEIVIYKVKLKDDEIQALVYKNYVVAFFYAAFSQESPYAVKTAYTPKGELTHMYIFPRCSEISDKEVFSEMYSSFQRLERALAEDYNIIIINPDSFETIKADLSSPAFAAALDLNQDRYLDYVKKVMLSRVPAQPKTCKPTPDASQELMDTLSTLPKTCKPTPDASQELMDTLSTLPKTCKPTPDASQQLMDALSTLLKQLQLKKPVNFDETIETINQHRKNCLENRDTHPKSKKQQVALDNLLRDADELKIQLVLQQDRAEAAAKNSARRKQAKNKPDSAVIAAPTKAKVKVGSEQAQGITDDHLFWERMLAEMKILEEEKAERAVQLESYQTKSNKLIVKEVRAANNGKFPGLYVFFPGKFYAKQASSLAAQSTELLAVL